MECQATTGNKLTIITGRTEFRGISDELDYFVNAPGTIYNLENNFVAIAADGVMSALNQVTFKAPIKEMKRRVTRMSLRILIVRKSYKRRRTYVSVFC